MELKRPSHLNEYQRYLFATLASYLMTAIYILQLHLVSFSMKIVRSVVQIIGVLPINWFSYNVHLVFIQVCALHSAKLSNYVVS